MIFKRKRRGYHLRFYVTTEGVLGDETYTKAGKMYMEHTADRAVIIIQVNPQEVRLGQNAKNYQEKYK